VFCDRCGLNFLPSNRFARVQYVRDAALVSAYELDDLLLAVACNAMVALLLLQG